MEKITKNNYLQTKDTIIEGLNNFIDYCNNHLEYIGFYQNLSFYNSEYTEVIEQFFTDFNIDKDKFYNGMKYYTYLEMAQDVRKNVDMLQTKVIEMFVQTNNKYPFKVIENLYNLRDFCYNGKTKNIKMNTLEEQNNQLKKYPHFDCSVKKPKYLGEYA